MEQMGKSALITHKKIFLIQTESKG